MSSTTAPFPRTGGALSGSLAAEWTKLWSIRSSWWCLAGALALMGLYAVGAGFDVSQPPKGAANMPRSEFVLQAQDGALGGLLLGQFALLALPVLAVTMEYSTGSIRSTLQCDPHRGRVLLAKVGVLAPAIFLTGTAFALVTAGLADVFAQDYRAFATGDVFAAVLRIGLYLAVAGTLAVGLGAALRSTAGTLTTVFLLVLLLPMILLSTGVDVLMSIAHYLPGTAGMEFVGTAGILGTTDIPYGPGVALVIFSAWAAAAGAAGYVLLRVRDA